MVVGGGGRVFVVVLSCVSRDNNEQKIGISKQ